MIVNKDYKSSYKIALRHCRYFAFRENWYKSYLDLKKATKHFSKKFLMKELTRKLEKLEILAMHGWEKISKCKYFCVTVCVFFLQQTSLFTKIKIKVM